MYGKFVCQATDCTFTNARLNPSEFPLEPAYHISDYISSNDGMTLDFRPFARSPPEEDGGLDCDIVFIIQWQLTRHELRNVFVNFIV